MTLLAVTDNDLVNIEAALTARDLAPGIRVVVRLFDQRLAQKVSKTLGFQSAFSASALAATTFAQSAIYGDILDSFEFGNVVVNAVRLVAGQSGKLMGRTVEQIQKEMDINVLVLERKEQVIWNPDCETVIIEGDVLLIVTDPEGFKRLDNAGCLTKSGTNGNGGNGSNGNH